MDLLSRREHSLAELKAKLAAREFAAEEIEATIEKLADEGLVSDARFAESFVGSRLRRGQGPVRIRMELERRGVGSDLVHAYLATLDEDWDELAAQVRARKFGAELPDDFNDKARQARFLQQRGFTAEQVRAAFRSGFGQD